MQKTSIVVPIKNPSSAKQRLADVLDADRRRQLANALMDHVLSVLHPTAEDCAVLVVTDSEEVESQVSRFGCSVLREASSRGETEAVELAARWSCEKGFTRQLVIPGDMPCVCRADILDLLAIPMKSPSVILCPATGDDGTNAILTSPPDAISFRFGRHSFPDYVEQSRRRGIACLIQRAPSLVLDLDTPEDLRTFLATKSSPDTQASRASPVYRLLSGWNLRERVA